MITCEMDTLTQSSMLGSNRTRRHRVDYILKEGSQTYYILCCGRKVNVRSTWEARRGGGAPELCGDCYPPQRAL